jgi:hypothetical protein
MVSIILSLLDVAECRLLKSGMVLFGQNRCFPVRGGEIDFQRLGQFRGRIGMNYRMAGRIPPPMNSAKQNVKTVVDSSKLLSIGVDKTSIGGRIHGGDLGKHSLGPPGLFSWPEPR